jgi:hypothetical protein
MRFNVRDVAIRDDGEGWTLYWTEGDGQQHEKLFHGLELVEDVIDATLAYFEDQISEGDIRIL